MPRDGLVFLDDILEACDKVARYTDGMTVDQFRLDEKTTDAVVRNLEIVGEAAKKLAPELRAMIPIDWKRIASLRDVLIHQYFGVDVDIIWDIVQTKVPDLHEQVARYLRSGQ